MRRIPQSEGDSGSLLPGLAPVSLAAVTAGVTATKHYDDAVAISYLTDSYTLQVI